MTQANLSISKKNNRYPTKAPAVDTIDAVAAASLNERDSTPVRLLIAAFVLN